MCWINILWINQIKILFGIMPVKLMEGSRMLSFLIAQPNVEYLFPIAPDLMTDIGFPRQESDWKKVAQGQHDSNLHSIREVWHYAYQELDGVI